MLHSFLVALAFLTILPVPFAEMPSAADVARSRIWYPLVGLLLGILLAGATALVGLLWPPPAAAFILILAWVCLTGALHLDGLADLCDGLFGGQTPVQRLRIMKDPHQGTFGVVAAMLVLLGKFAALWALLQSDSPYRALWAVTAAVAWGRSLVLLMAANAPYPRADGTGKASVRATRWDEAVPFSVAMACVLFVFALPAGFAVCGMALLVAFWVVVGLRRICDRLLGGVTGDCLGASIELSELAVLLIACLRVGPPA